MSERLEEIKVDVDSMHDCSYRDDVDGFLDVVEDFYDKGYFDWLIEQAEQNKRYREAMQEILDERISCWEVIVNKLSYALYKN